MAQKQGLQEHLDMLGLTPRSLSLRLPDVPQVAVERALFGQPIAHSLAVKICAELSKRHNLDSKRGTLTPEDLGIVTWKHEASKDIAMQRLNATELLRTMEPCDQVRLSAKIFEIQEQQRAQQAAIVQTIRMHEAELLRGLEIDRARRRQVSRQPVYGSPPSGMITRNGRTIDLARMQANLARSNRELAEMTRRVKAERAGYR